MNNNNAQKIRLAIFIFGVIVTVATFIWAASAQNQKLETTSSTVESHGPRISFVENAVIEIEANQKNILKTLDRIESKL